MHPLCWRLSGALLVCAAGTMPSQAATYHLNDFTVVSQGTTVFSDSFDNGVEPAGPAYGPGPLWHADAESDGHLALDASGGVGFGVGKVLYASPNVVVPGPSFSLTGRFDYTPPAAGEVYFVRLDDIVSGSPVRSYSVAVTTSGGETFATLAELSVTGTLHELAKSAPLVAAGHGQIALSFIGTADGQVRGAYQFVGGSGADGALQDIGSLAPASGHLFYATAFGSYAAPVPEPGTALSMLMGLGVLGAAARRQRRGPR